MNDDAMRETEQSKKNARLARAFWRRYDEGAEDGRELREAELGKDEPERGEEKDRRKVRKTRRSLKR